MLQLLHTLSPYTAFILFFFENLFIVCTVAVLGHSIQKKYNKQLQFQITRKEAMVASLTLLINTGITFAGYLLWIKGVIHFTGAISLRIVLDFLILFLIMDLIMYFLHVIIHLSKLYKPIHGLHHQYTSPSPIDLFVLSPLEAFSFGILWLILIFFYPANIYSVVIYLSLNVVFGMLGHLSVEPFPKRWISVPGLNLVCTSTFHFIHHQEKEFNFGFYTTIWDKLFGTLAPHYRDEFLKAKKADE